jgi:HK97 gp10 family phage protein
VTVTADFSEVDALARDLLDAPAVAAEKVLDALEEAGKAMVEWQLENAPDDRTGETSRTISWYLEEGDWAVVAGTESWYAHFVEGGTSRFAPRAFIFPSVDIVLAKFLSRLADAGTAYL